jgi:hypothetical protein
VAAPPITSDANRDASFFLKSDDRAAEYEKRVALAAFRPGRSAWCEPTVESKTDRPWHVDVRELSFEPTHSLTSGASGSADEAAVIGYASGQLRRERVT